MLSDEDIEKLCYGRIVYAPVYRSDHKDAAGPHYAVILDSDEEIAERDKYYAVVISSKTDIDRFILPVPRRIGLSGYFQCSWIVEIDLPGITKIGSNLEISEMIEVERKIREARDAKRRNS